MSSLFALFLAGEPLPDTVSLSGTTGSPNSATGFSLPPSTANCHWDFRSNGTVWKKSGSITQFNSGSEWVIPRPYANSYWIRATLFLGDTPAGPALNTWHPLTSNRLWSWSQTGVGFKDGTLKIEISSDASGSPILDSGYYRGFVQSEF